jgi:phospholipid/cholesterol/gamma-HCH transport system permease protein
MRSALVAIGRSSREALVHVGNLARMGLALGRSAAGLAGPSRRLVLKITLSQVSFGGVQAVGLVGTIATVLGAVSIVQAFSVLTGLADDLIGSLLVGVILRELGPLVPAVLFIARSGTAIATELGSMRLNGEVQMLQAHRIDPVAFVVLPRVLGAALAMGVLVAVFDVLGMLGGFTVAMFLMDLSFALLQSKVSAALTLADVWLSMVKAVVFGGGVAMVCCYFGLRVRRSSTELPRAVTRAVVASMTLVFVVDGLLAAAFYR